MQLQDAKDHADYLMKHLTDPEQMKIPWILHLLENYEILFPYRIFASPHYTVNEMQCSICGLETKDPKCVHITGHMYRGKIATTINKIEKIIEISLVENPADKRLIIKINNEDYNYEGIREAIKYIKHPLVDFDIFGTYDEDTKGKKMILNGTVMTEYIPGNTKFTPKHIECYMGRNNLDR